MFQSPGAILIRIGPLAIRWYALMIATGFLCCGFTASRLAKRWGIDPDEMFNCAVVCFISGILGARLYYVALSWAHFSTSPSEIFAIWNGGLSIHGGIIGGTIAGVIYCWRKRLPTLTVADIVGATIPIAQAIGRWGNFFNSEAFGLPVPDDFPLKLYIPPENRPPKFEGREFFHPTFLYESVWDLWLFGLLYFCLAERLKKYPGVLFCIYLAGYSIGRMLIEPIRVDSIMVGQMAAPFAVSAGTLVIALAGIGLLMMRYRKLPARTEPPEAPPAEPPTTK